jgi:hypothetical protein
VHRAHSTGSNLYNEPSSQVSALTLRFRVYVDRDPFGHSTFDPYPHPGLKSLPIEGADDQVVHWGEKDVRLLMRRYVDRRREWREVTEIGGRTEVVNETLIGW